MYYTVFYFKAYYYHSGKPFTVNVSTISVKSLPTAKRIVGGAARKRDLAPVHHHFAEQYLIKVCIDFLFELKVQNL
jgi:hypothetical protein